ERSIGLVEIAEVERGEPRRLGAQARERSGCRCSDTPRIRKLRPRDEQTCVRAGNLVMRGMLGMEPAECGLGRIEITCALCRSCDHEPRQYRIGTRVLGCGRVRLDIAV